MNGYKYFVYGHVQQNQFYDTAVEEYTNIMAAAFPSQRQCMKNTIYKAFLIVHHDGRFIQHTALVWQGKFYVLLVAF